MTPTTDTTPTAAQLAVYQTILRLTAQHGCPPTVREVAKVHGYRSPNGVMCHVTALRRKGWIEPDDGVHTSRAIMPAELRQAIKDAARRLILAGRAAK